MRVSERWIPKKKRYVYVFVISKNLKPLYGFSNPVVLNVCAHASDEQIPLDVRSSRRKVEGVSRDGLYTEL